MKLKISKELGQKIAVTVLMSGLFIFAYAKYFVQPALKSIKANSKKVEELSGRVNELERRAKRRDKLVVEIAQAEATWASLKALLPEKQELPTILKVMDKISRKFRVSLGSINPLALTDTDLYQEIPFGLVVTGSYHDVAMFLETMGKMERIFHARDLILSAGGASSETPWATVTGNLILVTFQYKGS